MSAFAKLAALLTAVAALSACRAEEQNRVTSFEKGVYLGQEDQEIDAETRERLKLRTQKQGF